VRVLKTPIQAPKVKAEFPVDLGARQIPKGQVLQPASVASRNVELSASCPRRLLNPRPVFGYVAKVITIAHQISIR
jgi:flagella basal body P-ring formation protein FlgA